MASEVPVFSPSSSPATPECASASGDRIEDCQKENLIRELTAFLGRIGLPVQVSPIAEKTFLPGLTIREGSLVIDPDRLEWPGDILHEAAHIAVTPPSRRATIGGKLLVTPAEEMAALAWSYAAALGAGIDPAIVFHEGGYKMEGTSLLSSYASGQHSGGPGVPMLQWWGMTTGFPNMNFWLRQGEDPS